MGVRLSREGVAQHPPRVFTGGMEIQKSQWGELSRVWGTTDDGQTVVVQGVGKPEKMSVWRGDQSVDEMPDLTLLTALAAAFDSLVRTGR